MPIRGWIEPSVSTGVSTPAYLTTAGSGVRTVGSTGQFRARVGDLWLGDGLTHGPHTGPDSTLQSS